jgi:sialic acid synthase SpsE
MLVSEIGQNHCGDMSLARKLILASKESGADLAKFQLYNSMAIYGVQQPQELTFKQADELFRFGQDNDIEVFFSVFDVERVEWCEKIGVQRYKIAATRQKKEVLEAVAKTDKPVIISQSRFEILDRLFKDVQYLYCVPKYPADLQEVNFGMIYIMGGFSDHTLGIFASQIALARGATIIEKHFRLDDNPRSPDFGHSVTPSEFSQLADFHNKCRDLRRQL